MSLNFGAASTPAIGLLRVRRVARRGESYRGLGCTGLGVEGLGFRGLGFGV